MAVTGIGGLFFRSRDSNALAAWYLTHLGVGAPEGQFVWDQQAGPTVFAPFKSDTDYFPADKQWMVNFRVDDLDALLAALRHEGCNVVDKMETSEQGKFGWVIDPEGNKVELWQPPTGQ